MRPLYKSMIGIAVLGAVLFAMGGIWADADGVTGVPAGSAGSGSCSASSR